MHTRAPMASAIRFRSTTRTHTHVKRSQCSNGHSDTIHHKQSARTYQLLEARAYGIALVALGALGELLEQHLVDVENGGDVGEDLRDVRLRQHFVALQRQQEKL